MFSTFLEMKKKVKEEREREQKRMKENIGCKLY